MWKIEIVLLAIQIDLYGIDFPWNKNRWLRASQIGVITFPIMWHLEGWRFDIDMIVVGERQATRMFEYHAIQIWFTLTFNFSFSMTLILLIQLIWYKLVLWSVQITLLIVWSLSNVNLLIVWSPQPYKIV